MIDIIPNWHPIFVHFTVGLLLTAAIFHLGAIFVKPALKPALTQVANWNLWIGTLISVATVTAGWLAFNSVTHDTPSHLAMIEHRNWAMVTFAAYLLVGLWSWFRAKQQKSIQWPLVVAVCAASLLLIATAWHGGELVYRYGLGVISLPNPDEHTHGEGAAHEHRHDEHAHEHSQEQSPENAIERTIEETEDHLHDDHDHDQSMMQTPVDVRQNSGAESEVTQDMENSNQPQSDHVHDPGQEHSDHEH
jgi:uncharacterized membrane protein